MLEYIIQGSTLCIAATVLGLETAGGSPKWVQLFGIATMAVIIGVCLTFLLTGLVLDVKLIQLLQSTDYFLCILTIACTVVMAAQGLETNFPLTYVLIVLSSILSALLLCGGILSTISLARALRGKKAGNGAWIKPVILSTKTSTAGFCLVLVVFSQFNESNALLCRAVCWAVSALETIVGALLLHFCKGYKISILVDVFGMINAFFLLACTITCLLLGSSVLLAVTSFLACLSATACAILTHCYYVLGWRQALLNKQPTILKEQFIEKSGAQSPNDSLAPVKLLPKSAGIAVRVATVFLATSALTIEAFCKDEGQLDYRLRILIFGILAFCIICSFGCMCVSQTWPQFAGTIVCADIFDAFALACASALSVSSHLSVSPPSVIFIWLAFASVCAIVFLEVFKYYKIE